MVKDLKPRLGSLGSFKVVNKAKKKVANQG